MLENQSVKEIQKNINNRQISIKEVVEYYLDKIEKLNPNLNAIVLQKDRELIIKDAIEKDKEQGRSECFHENGELATEASYKDGVLHGSYRKYLANGTLEATKEYNLGVQEGLQEIFYENGVVEERVVFEQDLPNGLWQHFDSDGTLIEERLYKNGEVVE